MNQSQNEKGEFALYQKGQFVEYSPVTYNYGPRVAIKYEPYLKLLLDAAKLENIPLKINSSLRTWDEQLSLRKRNVKDKSKVNDSKFLLTAPSTEFSPSTGKPGFSNHQNGRAFDFNTAIISVYKWLVKNGITYKFVRTVPSERWHWEYLPKNEQFDFVPKIHPTWDKLV